MKVKFNRAALVDALGLVRSVVPTKTPKPILQCVKISTDGDLVKVCATDVEAGINYKISQVEIETAGEIVVAADKFDSIIRESIDEVVLIESKDAEVKIITSDSQFTIYSHEPDQYPLVPDGDGSGQVQVGLAKLQIGIEQTLFAAAKESTRYAINGVLWEFKGKTITMVATDGRRLSRSVVHLDKPISDEMGIESIILPTKALALFDKVAGTSDEATLSIVDNKIVLCCGNAVISSNLVEGSFPKYEDIIPKENDKKVVLSTAAALSAVRRAALLVNEDSKGVKFSLEPNKLIITSRAPETGDAQIDMMVSYSEEPIEIGFNPGFLMDVLKVIVQDDFSLELGQSDRPGLIRCGEDFVYILMPVSLY